jgi:hypothetical protein
MVQENNVPHSNMKEAIELSLCLSGSNASIGRVVFRMNYILSEGNSRFHVYTIQAILAVKTNIGLSCEAYSEKIASNPSSTEEDTFFR